MRQCLVKMGLEICLCQHSCSSELNHPYVHTNMLLENLIFTIYKLETGLREISEEHDALLMRN